MLKPTTENMVSMSSDMLEETLCLSSFSDIMKFRSPSKRIDKLCKTDLHSEFRVDRICFFIGPEK